MHRILIWDDFKLEDRGGQFGYLYQIHEYLKVFPDDSIVFLSDISDNSVSEANRVAGIKTDKNETVFGLKEIIKKNVMVSALLKKLHSIKDKIVTAYYFCWGEFRKDDIILPSGININDFQFIHFHFNPTASRFITNHPDYKGKVILTSHCPCSWTDEHLTYYMPWMRHFRGVALYNECRTYKLVNYLMFPCKEAREAYEKVPKIRRLFKNNENKFFYVPSAILDKSINVNSMQRYESLGIPDDAFVITFFGRHNAIKGYDILTRLGKELLARYDNLYFLCAGRIDIKPLQHPRWIELGFINNTSELLIQSDLYVLPNRETYFDLITLEVLRAGVKLIMSDTGGNKYFRHFSDNEIIGVELFDINDFDQLFALVEKSIIQKSNDSYMYKRFGSSNRVLYEKHFIMQKYIDNYHKALDVLCD